MTLEVLEPKCVGSAAESASDEGAGGGTFLGDRGSRARRARRRAAGVSARRGVALMGVGNALGVGSGLRDAIDLGCIRGVGNPSSSSCMVEKNERAEEGAGWGVVSGPSSGM